jgi:hypothetical protein
LSPPPSTYQQHRTYPHDRIRPVMPSSLNKLQGGWCSLPGDLEQLIGDVCPVASEQSLDYSRESREFKLGLLSWKPGV